MAACAPAASLLMLAGAFHGCAKGSSGDARQLGTLAEAVEQINGGPPAPRAGHSAVWDDVNSDMFVFGGGSSGGPTTVYNDVWRISGLNSALNWNVISPSGTAPSARENHSAVWDHAGNEMIVFGGTDGNGNFDSDLSALSFAGGGSAWIPLSAANGPSARAGHVAVWDSADSQMIVFGGEGAGGFLSDVWTLSSIATSPTWTQLTFNGTTPTARGYLAAVWDSNDEQLVIFGGANSSGTDWGDVWTLSSLGAGETPVWTELSPGGTAPSARDSDTAVWDAADKRMLVFAGHDASGDLSDVWALSLQGGTANWNALSPTGSAPPSRDLHSAVWDATAGEMIVFAGESSPNGTDFADTWQLAFPGGVPAWTGCDSVSCASSCSTSPAVPVLGSPADGSSANTCGLTFSWSQPAETGSSTFSVILNGTTLATGLTSNSFTLAPTVALNPAGNTWQVTATGCLSDASAPSATATFGITPVAPTLVSPASGSTTYCNPAFEWSDTGGGAYSLLLGASPPISVIESGIAATSYQLTPSSPELSNGAYLWQVSTVDCSGQTATSGFGTLSVNNTPPAPSDLIVVQVVDGFTTDQNPTFTWSESGEEPDVTYELIIDGQVVESGIAGTSWTLTSAQTLAGGPHAWSVTAVGCLGASKSSGTSQPFNVDVTPPAPFNLISPMNGSWVNQQTFGPIEFAWSATTDSGGPGIQGYQVNISGPAGVSLPQVATTTASWDASSAPNGEYQWNVVARDVLGIAQNSTSTFTIGLDSIPPAAATYPAQVIESTVTPTLTWTAGSDSLSGLNEYEIFIAGNLVATGPASSPTTWTAPASQPVAQGTMTYSITTIDNAGNSTAGANATLIIDITPPTVPTLVSPIGGVYVQTLLPTFQWNASSDPGGSGIAYYQLWLDGVQQGGNLAVSTTSQQIAVAPGPHSWFVVVFDNAKLSSQSATGTFTIDTSPPAAFGKISPLSGATVATQYPTFCWNSTSDAGGVASYTLAVTVANTGATFTTIYSSANTGTGTICEQSLNSSGAPQALPTGTSLTWEVTAADEVGNTTLADSGTSWNLTLSPDTAPPACAITMPTGSGFFGSPFAFAGTASDPPPGSDIATVNICVDSDCTNGVWWPTTTAPAAAMNVSWSSTWSNATGGASSSPATGGSHTVGCEATNLAGVTQAAPTTVTFNVDIPPGAFDLTTPANGTSSCVANEPTLTWSAAQPGSSGLDHYEVEFWVDQMQSTTTQTFSAQTNTSFTLPAPLGAGTWDWTVLAFDANGFSTQASETFTFVAAGSGPSAVVLGAVNPSNEYEGVIWATTDTVTLNWQPSSTTGCATVASYDLVVAGPGGLQQASVSGTSFTITASPDGSYTWSVQAVDSVGQTSLPTAGSFSVDTAGPVVSNEGIEPPLFDSYTASQSPVLEWSVSDTAGPGVASQTVFLDVTPFQFGLGSSDTSVDLSTIPAVEPEGAHEWYVQADDNLGVSGQTTESIFYVDLTGPNSVTLTSTGGIGSSATPQVCWNMTNDPNLADGSPGSGVGSYQIFVQSSTASSGTSVATIAAIQSASSQCGSPTSQMDGAYSVWVVAYDRVGNASTGNQTESITIDTVPPSAVTFISPTPAQGSFTNNVQPTIAWNAATVPAYAALATYSYTITDPNGTQIYSDSFSAASTTFQTDALQTDGQYCVSVTASDTAGNTGQAAVVCFNIDTASLSAPTLVSPSDNAFVATATPALQWDAVTDPEGSSVAYQITLDGNVIASSTVLQFQLQTALVPDGTHTWSVGATDGAGNSSTNNSTFTFTVDTTPPGAPVVVSPSQSSQPWVATQQPQLTWTAPAQADASGVCNYLVEIDSGAAVTLGPVTTYTPSSMLTNGSHTWTVAAVDCVGNVGAYASPVGAFGVDSTQPTTVTIISPANGSATNNPLPPVNWTVATDAFSAIQYYDVILDQVNFGLFDSPADFSWGTQTNLTDGQHSLSIAGVNQAGTYGVEPTSTFTVDTATPAAPVLETPANAAFVNTLTPTLSWSTPEPTASGTSGYVVSMGVGSGAPQPDATPVTGTQFSLSVLPDGVTPLSDGMTYTWSVQTVNGTGTTSVSSAQFSFTVEITGPTQVTQVSPPNNGWVNTTTPTFAWNASSSASGIVSYVVSVDSGASDAQSVTVPANKTSVTLSQAQALTTAASGNPHVWSVIAVDNAGNQSSAQGSPFQVNINTVAPGAVTITAPANGSATNQTSPAVTWTAASAPTAGCGIASYLVTFDPGNVNSTAATVAAPLTTFTPTTALATGSHTVTVRATDIAGNQSSIASGSFTIDTTPPTSPANLAFSPSSGMWVGVPPITLNWTASVDAHSTVTGYIVSIAAGSGTLRAFASMATTPQFSLTKMPGGAALTDGTSYTWSVVAQDAAGNQSAASATSTFTVDLLAPVAPAGLMPAAGVWLNTGTPALSWSASTDTESGVESYSLSVGTETPQLLPATTTTGMPSTSLAESATAYTWTVTAEDNVGNISTAASSTFLVDTTPPTPPTITSPAANDCIDLTTPTLTLDWSGASDALSGLASANVTIDSDATPFMSMPPTAPATTTTIALTQPLPDGMHTWSVVAFDNAGNQSTANTGSFSINSATPACQVEAVATEMPGVYSVVVTASLGQTASGGSECGSIAHVQVQIGEQASFMQATINGAGAWVVPWMAPAAGTYSLACQVSDNAGNMGSSAAPFSVTIGQCFAPTSSCSITGECSQALDGMPCDGGSACTSGDTCNSSGVCEGTPLNNSQCMDAGSKSADGGAQSPGQPKGCGCASDSFADGALSMVLAALGAIRRRRKGRAKEETCHGRD